VIGTRDPLMEEDAAVQFDEEMHTLISRALKLRDDWLDGLMSDEEYDTAIAELVSAHSW
jgi:hypothetical protein